MKTFCAWCGAERADTTTACQHCGREETTNTPPSSQETCVYCGARPAWSVTWWDDDEAQTVWLCAQCDEREVREFVEGFGA